MLSLALAVLVTQAPPLPPGGKQMIAPTAIETARLYFLAGDLTTSREWCERGLKREAKACKPLLKDLAEYKFLMSKFEELTLDEAKQVIALDRRISPKDQGKPTKPIFERYVSGPMTRAKLWAEQGAAAEAVRFVEDALKVDPTNADARALLKQLTTLADAGVSLDGGR